VPAIVNAAYFVGASKLEIVSDDFTAAVSAVALTPTVPNSEFKDIGGGVQSFVGAPSWTLDLTYAQDWTTATSLSHKLMSDIGLTKVVKLTPVTGGRLVTVSVVIQPGAIGGAADSVATATVSLKVTGQPVWSPAV
jgi:hypothetical protein